MPSGAGEGAPDGSGGADADLVRRLGLPAKLLIVHQFRGDMLTGGASIEAMPEVDLAIDMDGFGGPADKLEGYNAFSLAALNDMAVPTPLNDAVNNMKAIEGVLESGKRDAWVTLE